MRDANDNHVAPPYPASVVKKFLEALRTMPNLWSFKVESDSREEGPPDEEDETRGFALELISRAPELETLKLDLRFGNASADLLCRVMKRTGACYHLKDLIFANLDVEQTDLLQLI